MKTRERKKKKKTKRQTMEYAHNKPKTASPRCLLPIAEVRARRRSTKINLVVSETRNTHGEENTEREARATRPGRTKTENKPTRCVSATWLPVRHRLNVLGGPSVRANRLGRGRHWPLSSQPAQMHHAACTKCSTDNVHVWIVDAGPLQTFAGFFCLAGSLSHIRERADPGPRFVRFYFILFYF